MRPNGNVARA